MPSSSDKKLAAKVTVLYKLSRLGGKDHLQIRISNVVVKFVLHLVQGKVYSQNVAIDKILNYMNNI